MSVSRHVLQLLVLMMGLATCFSWDIVVANGTNLLQFYTNGTLTHTENIPTATRIYSITYDPVHNRILFVDSHTWKHHLSIFDLSTKNIQPLFTRSSYNYLRFTYDPVTQQVFFRDDPFNIYSLSLSSASSNKSVDSNLIVTLGQACDEIAVDSCGRYIYWASNKAIERARFDGSERQVLISTASWWITSLTIDQQTQKMYWADSTIYTRKDQVSIKSADLDGKNQKTLYIITDERGASSLTVSNDSVYWYGHDHEGVWKMPKNHPRKSEVKLFSTYEMINTYSHNIAANYSIKDQLKGNHSCETLKSLIPNESESDGMLCVHGTKVSGESRCECTQGYTGDRCDVYVSQNYCLEGNCIVNAEGDRDAGYDGERCSVSAVAMKCIQTISMLRDMLNADLPTFTLGKEVKPTCATTVV